MMGLILGHSIKAGNFRAKGGYAYHLPTSGNCVMCIGIKVKAA